MSGCGTVLPHPSAAGNSCIDYSNCYIKSPFFSGKIIKKGTAAFMNAVPGNGQVARREVLKRRTTCRDESDYILQ